MAGLRPHGSHGFGRLTCLKLLQGSPYSLQNAPRIPTIHGRFQQLSQEVEKLGQSQPKTELQILMSSFGNLVQQEEQVLAEPSSIFLAHAWC